MVDVVGGKMSLGYGDDADFLKLMQEVLQLVNDTINVQGRILVILIGVCCAVILLGIFLVVHIM